MKRFLLFVLSFFKWKLELKDYPVRVQQPISRDDDRVLVFPWEATIAGWWQLCGRGSTKEEAYADLTIRFARYRDEHEVLPRPGVSVITDYDGYMEMKRHGNVIMDFYKRVLHMEYREDFSLNAASLYDYYDGELNDLLISRIKVIYGVDISNIPGLNMMDIIKRVRYSGLFQYADGVWQRSEPGDAINADSHSSMDDDAWGKSLDEAWQGILQRQIDAGRIMEYSYDAVHKRYYRSHRMGIWILLGTMIAGGLVGMGLFTALAMLVNTFRSQGVFLIRPEFFYWMLPSLFLGLCGSVPVHCHIQSRKNGTGREQRLLDEIIVLGFCSWRLATVLLRMTLLAVSVYVILSLNSYTRFDEDHIAFNGIREWHERLYSYNEVSEIYAVSHIKASNGRILNEPHYILIMGDGRTWTTRRDDRNVDPEQDNRIMQHVSQQSGIHVKHVDFYVDLQ